MNEKVHEYKRLLLLLLVLLLLLLVLWLLVLLLHIRVVVANLVAAGPLVGRGTSRSVSGLNRV